MYFLSDSWLRADLLGACPRDSGQGSGCRVQGSGCMVQGAWFRVQGAGCRVQGSGFRGQGSGFRVQGAGCQGPGSRVQGAGCRVQGAGMRGEESGGTSVQGPVCRVQGFRVQGAGTRDEESAVRTGSWTGPPRGKTAPRVGISSTVFGVRGGTSEDDGVEDAVDGGLGIHHWDVRDLRRDRCARGEHRQPHTGRQMAFLNNPRAPHPPAVTSGGAS